MCPTNKNRFTPVVDSRTALLVGASGLVGGHCLEKLLSLDVYSKVHVLARSPLDTDHYSAKALEKFELHLVDFDNLEAASIIFSVDDVFCCLGTTLKKAGSISAFKKVDYDYCLKVAEMAKDKNVGHFLIVTAVNASENALAYYSRTKGQLEVALKELEFNCLSIFHPSLLLGERSEHRLIESVGGKLAKGFNRLLPSRMTSFKAIEGEAVGKAMAVLASDQGLRKSEHRIEYYRYNDIQSLASL